MATLNRAAIETGGWRQIPAPDFMQQVAPTTAWVKGPCRVLYTMMEPHFGSLWCHASIACTDRYPTWDEILDARYTFFTEDDEVFQYLPPKREYLNLHKNCFHLWHRVGARILPAATL